MQYKIIIIINFISLILSFLGLAILYLISLEPKKREKQIGEKAWKQSKNFRTIGFFCEMLGMLNIILWVWYPIPELFWQVNSNPLVGIIIAFVIGVPCLILLIVGLIHAGKESWGPSQDTTLYQGIYGFIRHPQAIGEFPLFIALSFGVNSWFLVVLMTIYNIIYLPIMKNVEEADLIRRFGEKYKEYQRKTGAFFPKLK